MSVKYKEFTVAEVIDIVKNSKYFDDLSLVEAVQLRDDIFDLKEMPRYIEKVLLDVCPRQTLCSSSKDEDLIFEGHLNRWCAKYNKDYCERFGISEEDGYLVLPLWIGNILNEYVSSKTEKDCND